MSQAFVPKSFHLPARRRDGTPVLICSGSPNDRPENFTAQDSRVMKRVGGGFDALAHRQRVHGGKQMHAA